MENRFHPLNQTPTKLLAIHIDPQLMDDIPEGIIDWTIFQLVPANQAQFSILKKDSRLWVQFPDGDFCDYPFYFKNISRLLESFKSSSHVNIFPAETFQSFIKSTQTIEKKIFSNVSMNPGENVKDLWDEIIKKVNLISTESHSLKGLVEKILEIQIGRASCRERV